MKSKKGSIHLSNMAIPIISILLAFIVGMIIMAVLGANPIVAIQALFKGSFGGKANIGTTLAKATPLLFTALCACFAYKCGVFNLGGEGQFIMGSVACCYVALCLGVEGPIGTILCIVIGTMAGAIWGLIPGLLKIYRGQSELIITIMMNYIATLFMGVIYTNWLRDGSVPQTASVPESIMIPRVLNGMRFTWAFVIAVVVGIIIYYYLFNTSSGFKARAVGINVTASRFSGFPVNKYILLSFVVAGAIAGLGGSVELLGTQYRLINGFGAGYGFDGVAMALIGRLNPIATMIVVIFFAALRTGAMAMQAATGVPTAVADIIQALVIVFTVAGMALVQLPNVKAKLERIGEKATGMEVSE